MKSVKIGIRELIDSPCDRCTSAQMSAGSYPGGTYDIHSPPRIAMHTAWRVADDLCCMRDAVLGPGWDRSQGRRAAVVSFDGRTGTDFSTHNPHPSASRVATFGLQADDPEDAKLSCSSSVACRSPRRTIAIPAGMDHADACVAMWRGGVGRDQDAYVHKPPSPTCGPR